MKACLSTIACTMAVIGSDGRPHLEQLLPCLEAHKPVFIDKPIAGTLVDAIKIFDAAKKTGIPIFSSSSLRFGKATQAVRGGTWRSEHGETSEALFLTSGYTYDTAESVAARFAGEETGMTYSRLQNPTVEMLEERIALMEGADAVRCQATGMAAMTAALLCQLQQGDHVVAARAAFGSCRWLTDSLLPKFGITTTMIDSRDNDQWQAAIQPNTKVFFFETPANPTLDVVDLEAVCTLARASGITTVIDNVFATPVLQKPLQFGADVVAYSATKHIDGHGRVLGGVVCCTRKFHDDLLFPYLRHTGGALSPFNAWVLLKGLETLSIRVKAQTESAAAIADALATHPKISRLVYPGRADHPQADIVKKQMRAGSTLIGFEVKGGKAAAFRTLNALKLARISNNLGDSKSIVTHPATTTHQRLTPEARAELGISEGFIRFSAGLEHKDDLIEDLNAALEKA